MCTFYYPLWKKNSTLPLPLYYYAYSFVPNFSGVELNAPGKKLGEGVNFFSQSLQIDPSLYNQAQKSK